MRVHRAGDSGGAGVCPARTSGGEGGTRGGEVEDQVFEIAAREASQSGRPMLVEFTASWCPPCQKMKSVVWTNDRVADEANARFVPVMVDVDEQPKMAEYYGGRRSR